MINTLYWVYMLMNLYTDSKKLETYNRLHFFMLIFLFMCYLYNALDVFSFLKILFIAITIGIIFEILPFVKSSSGDTKMIAISSLYIFLVTPLKPFIIPIILFSVFRLISALFSVSFIVIGMIYININSRYKTQLEEGVNFGVMAYRGTFKRINGVLNISTETPATIAIIISTFIITFIY